MKKIWILTHIMSKSSIKEVHKMEKSQMGIVAMVSLLQPVLVIMNGLIRKNAKIRKKK